MNLKVLDFLLCRTPVFSVQDDLEKKWPELKELIHEASPALFQVIKDLDYSELNKLDRKIHFSIWKYFNRAKFRATPFGRLAAFSTLSLSDEPGSQVVLEQNLATTNLTDWSEKDSLTKDPLHFAINSLYFQTNSTVYRVGNEIRFIRFRDDFFEIGSVTTFPELNTIIMLCVEKTSRHDVYNHMLVKHRLNNKEVDLLLEQLLTLQLLLSDQTPNITGDDYFKRLKIGQSLPYCYTIAERKVISGGLDSNKIRNIPELIKFLQSHLPGTDNPSLIEFKNAFIKKFEQAAIPLTIAMDPEVGIGYNNLAQTAEDQDLVNFLTKGGQQAQHQDQITYGDLHRFLLNSLINEKEIRLEDFGKGSASDQLPLPNSLSVMLHFYGDRPVIESIGGCTANALLGRFTVASQAVTELARQVSNVESVANPDIMFFDIAYQAEKKVDNVNRRGHLYSHELPILTWSSHHSVIQLDDILVTVRNGEILLWSKKFKKRLIPRVPSAYNYSRSDLAVFRFLCDLQHQGIRSDLSFKMQHFFPGLTQYPRVIYKNIIVSPAMWLVTANILALSKADRSKEAMLALKEWLKHNGINLPFKAGISDQKLCFNPGNESDLNFFLAYCRQNAQSEFYISEGLLNDGPEVSNDKGQPLVSEYVLNYAHRDQVYRGVHLNMVAYTHPFVDRILPGGEWLYFEIYCHPSRANAVLLKHIDCFLKSVKQYITKWFFIRYEDPKPHLRLRIQLTDESRGYWLTKQLDSKLKEDFLTGLISDLQIKTYNREIERYGRDKIASVEYLFFVDSKNIIHLLSKCYSTTYLYLAALTLLQNLLKWCYNDIQKELRYAESMANNFGKEFNMTGVSFKKINHSFLIYRQTQSQAINKFQKETASYKKPFLKTLDRCRSENESSKLMADVFHMHVNRLFAANQRSHEAIIYQYLVRSLKARRATSANPKECQARL